MLVDAGLGFHPRMACTASMWWHITADTIYLRDTGKTSALAINHRDHAT